MAEQGINNMTSDEVTKALEKILKATDGETQINMLRVLMRYQNIDGLDLEEILEKELDQLNLGIKKPLRKRREIRKG